MSQEAAAEFEKAVALFGDASAWRWALALSHAAAGRKDAALEILLELKSETPVPAYDVAYLSLALGDQEEALDWLEEGVKERAKDMRCIKSDPFLDPLRDHPRFQELLTHMNFPP
jgi:serine/threonine-protein kinase